MERWLSYKGTCHVILVAKLHDMYLYKTDNFFHINHYLKSVSKVAHLHRFYCIVFTYAFWQTCVSKHCWPRLILNCSWSGSPLFAIQPAHLLTSLDSQMEIQILLNGEGPISRKMFRKDSDKMLSPVFLGKIQHNQTLFPRTWKIKIVWNIIASIWNPQPKHLFTLVPYWGCGLSECGGPH